MGHSASVFFNLESKRYELRNLWRIAIMITNHGTRTREADSVVAVTFWVIPGDSDYEHAWIGKRYFSSREEAKAVCKKYRRTPEMACLVELKQLER